MVERRPITAVLALEVLRGSGSVSWAALLEAGVPVATLRDICREHGLSPKGGFRLDRAPAKVLAPLLAEQRDATLVDELVQAFHRGLAPDRAKGDADEGGEAAAESGTQGDPPDPQPSKDVQELARAARALERVRGERDRERAAATRHRTRADQLQQRLEHEEEVGARLRAQVRFLQREMEIAGTSVAPVDVPRDEVSRMRELERDLEGLEGAEAQLRRRLALARTRERELEEQVAELEDLVPKGRRRRRRVEEPPEPKKRFTLPRLAPSFYKSLEGKDRRSVERAMQAVLLYATEGPAYPGLEVKQLGGQDLWSMRASRKLRIYFRMRSDGDVDVLALGAREDQTTMLRRLKET